MDSGKEDEVGGRGVLQTFHHQFQMTFQKDPYYLGTPNQIHSLLSGAVERLAKCIVRVRVLVVWAL
jgi:hypothetical protein